MPRYKKRTAEEAFDGVAGADAELTAAPSESLTKLRNMWQFASLMQYIYLFGHVVKIPDDFDVEDLEAECSKPASETLAQIGLALLKYVSSHRGLTPEIFEEYTRRQYLAKAPHRNPFGDGEDPIKFHDLDIYTRITVLHQLSTWTFGNVDRIRSLMPQDEDQHTWRMQPLGWDKDDRAYFVLDDNRLYRRTDEPPPPPTPKPKAKSKTPKKKAKSRGTRASKRRKTAEDSEDDDFEAAQDDTEAGAADDTLMADEDSLPPQEEPGFGFTSKTWECVAITLDDFQEFMATIFRSRDPNEKQLRSRIEKEVLPVIEKRAEALRQKELKKLRDVENLQKLANAKRSSRLADKADKDRQEREEREAEEKRYEDLRMARKEQERQKKIEEGHESRRLTREQRAREREVKRILHEEELTKLEENEARATSQDLESHDAEAKRISERVLKTQREQHKKELEKLAVEDGKWIFDCAVCGMHGDNLDDGTHIACDRCSVWQHSKCHGFSPKQAESEDFNFICLTCKRKEEDANKPKIPTLKLGKNRQDGSPESQKGASRPSTAAKAYHGTNLPDHISQQLDGIHVPHVPRPTPGPFGQLANGPSLSPQAQANGASSNNFLQGDHAMPRPHAPQQAWSGSPLPPPARPSSGYANLPPAPFGNGYAPPHHQQHHQYAHHNAMAAAGGHPSYAANPQASSRMHPMPPHQAQPYYPPQVQHSQQQYYYSHQHQRPGSAHMNGYQPNSSFPPQNHPQTYGSPAANGAHTPRLQQSPKTNLPPPGNIAQGRPGASPTKSSPPAPQPPQPMYQQQSPRLVYQTPHHYTNGIVADGLAGPWPANGRDIPQKHDLTPAPPISYDRGHTSTIPEVAALTPSPSQPAACQANVIPVKKLPEAGPSPQTAHLPR